MLKVLLGAGIILISLSCTVHDQFRPMYPQDCETFKAIDLCREKPKPASWFKILLIHTELDKMN